jgi:hypothetical protein
VGEPGACESEPPGWFAALGFSHMSKTSKEFDFRKSVAYDVEAKRLFHSRAKSQLVRIATALDLEPGSYDLRSNHAGIAVSGEIILHGDHLYVQVSQSAMGHHCGILFRTCSGRKDHVGGPNNFASLDLLDRPDELAYWVRNVCDV